MDHDLFSIERLYQAYRDCRRNKRSTYNALRFEIGLLDHLYSLREELINRTYHPARSICFVQRRPKLREVFAADFRDRVVHHLLVGYLEDIFERRFIEDSYACRKEKGVHAALTRLGSFLDRVTANGTKKAWYLKLDISGFFMNIDKQILYEMICRREKREEIRWLSHRIIFHDCTKDYLFKGNPWLLKRIPAHKTLFCVARGKGLPIGNLTSQFFANVYLNDLDQYVKRGLGCRFYLRYCDDFLLLDGSPDKLQRWNDRIEGFLLDHLMLEVNRSQFRLRPVSSGIDFLGYVAHRRHVLVRRRVVNHFQEKLDDLDVRMVRQERKQAVSCQYPARLLNKLRPMVSSYLGHLRWANSRKLIQSMFERHPSLRMAFMIHRGKLVPRYMPPKTIRGLRKTYKWWVPAEPRPFDLPESAGPEPLWIRDGQVPKVLVFFPVGRFYELYECQALMAHEMLGLKLVKGLRGFRYGCGFHQRWRSRFIGKSLRMGLHVALIRAEKNTDGTVQYRLARLFRGRCRSGK